MIRFEQLMRKVDDKVYTLENILFEKDETGRMQLFDKVFGAIREVD